jgi:hypothetical protein
MGDIQDCCLTVSRSGKDIAAPRTRIGFVAAELALAASTSG